MVNANDAMYINIPKMTEKQYDHIVVTPSLS